jgi:hypothetical protein
MKTLIILCALLFTISAFAEIGLKFNRLGEFVPPDKVLQARGFKSYLDGDIGKSINLLKSSAKFGNDVSKYYIALMYFEKKDWTQGYAWLNLINQPVKGSDALISKYKVALSEKELLISSKLIQQLQKEYNPVASLQRRSKWERSIKVTGTRLTGIDALARRNIRLSVGDEYVSVEATAIRDTVKHYVNNL